MMEPLLYQPGDLVTIRSDLIGDRYYPVLYGPSAGEGNLFCNDDMVKYGGKTYEVEGYDDDEPLGRVWTDEYSWIWHGFEVTKEIENILKENNNV